MKKTSRWYRGAVVLGLLAAAMGAGGGCSSQVESSAKEPVTANEEANLETVDAPEEMVASNVIERLFRESLSDVHLRPEQQERVRTIQGATIAKLSRVREARRSTILAVADGVLAGRLDDAKVQRSIESLVREVETAKPALQEGLNELHGTLDPDQRERFVRSLRTRGMQLRERGEARGGPRGVVKARLGRLAKELALTQDQKVAIRDRARTEFRGGGVAFEGPAEFRERMREVGTAFLRDDFDAKTLDVGKEAPELTRKIATGLVRFVNVVLPELDSAQRTKLASLIRTRGNALENASKP
jgi:Spy/CpxP family protein refolding chaperone